MKISRLAPCDCPRCDAHFNGTVSPEHDVSLDAIPRGAVVLIVCSECGAVLQRTPEGKLALVRDVPPWFRAEADRIRTQARDRLSEMRARSRKRPARGAVRATERLAQSYRTAEAMRIILEEWCKRFPSDRPVFALPHVGLEIASSLAKVGHNLARNDAAHTLVDAWCGLPNEPELAALGVVEPTVMMLRMCLDKERITCESLSLTELGLGPRGGLN